MHKMMVRFFLSLLLTFGIAGAVWAQPSGVGGGPPPSKNPPPLESDEKEGFWDKFGRSAHINRGNENVGRLYLFARQGGVVYDIDRPSVVHLPSADAFPPPSTYPYADARVSTTTDTGIWASLGVGTGLGNNMRSELEVSILQFSAETCIRTSGDKSCQEQDPAISNIMVHAYYDIDIPAFLRKDMGFWNDFLPYVGAGFGFSFSDTAVQWDPKTTGTRRKLIHGFWHKK